VPYDVLFHSVVLEVVDTQEQGPFQDRCLEMSDGAVIIECAHVIRDRESRQPTKKHMRFDGAPIEATNREVKR